MMKYLLSVAYMAVSENRIPPKIRCLVILLTISVELWRYATFYRSDPNMPMRSIVGAAREDPVPMIGGSALENQAHRVWFHVVTKNVTKNRTIFVASKGTWMVDDGGSSGPRLRRCFQHTFHIIFPSFWNPQFLIFTHSHGFSMTFHHFSESGIGTRQTCIRIGRGEKLWDQRAQSESPGRCR